MVSALKNQQHGSLPSFDGSEDRGRSAAIAARAFGVSQTTVEKAIRVQKHDPERFQKIKDGEITVK